MSYPNYNNTMIGDSFDTSTSGTVTIPNNTSNGIYWGLNGTSASPGQVLTSTGTSTGSTTTG